MKIPTTLPAAMLAVIASLVLAGCSFKPVDELKMAGIAMDGARNVEASVYAPKDWNRAQAQWEEAVALIHMGRYSEARNILIMAIASYNDAQDTAKGSFEKLQIETHALQSSAETELKKIEQGCKNSKVELSVRKRIEASLPNLDAKMAAIKAEINAKDYRTAHMDGQEVVTYMADLEKKLGISN